MAVTFNDVHRFGQVEVLELAFGLVQVILLYIVHNTADKTILDRALEVLPMTVLSVGLFLLQSIVQMYRARVQDLCAPSGRLLRIPEDFCRGLSSSRRVLFLLLCESVQKDVRVRDFPFLQDLHFHHFPILYKGRDSVKCLFNVYEMKGKEIKSNNPKRVF